MSILIKGMPMPTIEPERKKGKWIVGEKTWVTMMQCNLCNFTTFVSEGHFAQCNFCPNCGADMREVDNG